MIVSEKRLAANRANACQSTGPRTPAGKARSAANAARHGLCAETPVLSGESPDAYAAFAAAVAADLRPRGAAQQFFAERAAQLMWRLGRVPAVERAMAAAAVDASRANHVAEMFDRLPHLREPFTEPSPARVVAGFFLGSRRGGDGSNPLALARRYEASLERSLQQVMRQLALLQEAAAERGEDATDVDEDDSTPEAEPESEAEVAAPAHVPEPEPDGGESAATCDGVPDRAGWGSEQGEITKRTHSAVAADALPIGPAPVAQEQAP